MDEKLLKTPIDPDYDFFLLFTDNDNRFRFYILDKPFYIVSSSSHSRLGSLPKQWPSMLAKPLLYWQFLPKYF